MLRILDSFDHYATPDIPSKWELYTQDTGGGEGGFTTINPSGGRRGGGALHIHVGLMEATPPIAKNFGNAGSGTITSACIVGFAFKATGPGVFTTDFKGGSLFPDMGVKSLEPQGRNVLLLIRSQDNGGLLYGQIGYTIENNGQIHVWRGEWEETAPDAGFVFLGRTSRSLKPDQWYFLEFKTLIHNSAGTIDIRVNGESWLSLSGQDTYLQPDGTPHVGWCEVVIGHMVGGGSVFGPYTGSHDWYFDDLYIADGDTTATNTVNDFWGDHAILVRQVTANGALTQLSPSGADPNWQQVNDGIPDGDTSYNQAANALDADLYVVEDAVGGAGATVEAVQVLADARATLGSAYASVLLRSAGVNYQGGTFLVGVNYRYARHIWTRDPTDNSVISGADFNAFQIGVIRG